MRRGADQRQLRPELLRETGTSCEVSGAGLTALGCTNTQVPSSDILKRTAAGRSPELASRPHLLAIARNCPRLTTSDVATVVIGPLMRECHWPSVPHVC